MKYKRHKKIKRYKTIKLHEYAVVFKDSDQLIDFVCCINTRNVINSSLYIENGCYTLLLSTNKFQSCKSHIAFNDKLHIDKIKLSAQPICKRDAVHKMQQAFIRP